LRISERYIISLTLAYMLTTAAFSLYGQSSLDLYVSVYILEYFILTLLHSPFNPRAQKVIDITGYVLFVIFMVIVVLKVLEILFGARFL
jgi:TRAP-type mannitol/chloroaromatic compound transport system permease small subunit